MHLICYYSNLNISRSSKQGKASVAKPCNIYQLYKLVTSIYLAFVPYYCRGLIVFRVVCSQYLLIFWKGWALLFSFPALPWNSFFANTSFKSIHILSSRFDFSIHLHPLNYKFYTHY